MLDVRDVTYRLTEDGQKKKILDSVSFELKTGEFLAITGPNGSGKSTLAKIIMGLLKQSSGKIIFNEQDISKLDVTKRAKLGISFSFQQPVKFKGLTVYDLINIASGELISPKEAGKILNRVGLLAEKYLHREINDKLSGGELKRIEIATILAKNADLLIFDEPEAGIDLWSFSDLVKIFKKLQKEGKTIIVISHQERILKIADKIMILEKGRIKELNKAPKVLPKIQGSEHES